VDNSSSFTKLQTMTNLSPAAQAVLDAYWDDAPLESGARCGLAAALRAAADQICMKQPLGDTDADAGVFAAHHAISTSLLAIAAELEEQ
jgi:hypothetical protein